MLTSGHCLGYLIIILNWSPWTRPCYLSTEPHSDLCGTKSCEFGSLCNTPVSGGPPICECPTECPNYGDSDDSFPICSSEGKTYPNKCELDRFACSQTKNIGVNHIGICDPKMPGEVVRVGQGSSVPSSTASTPIAGPPDKSSGVNTEIQGPQGTPSYRPNCRHSKFGCCSDGGHPTGTLVDCHPPAKPPPGPRMTSTHCNCNKMGSVGESCDPLTNQCECYTGAGGPKCDRCYPGFWGLGRKELHGSPGCAACECSKFGSVRDDCEQMTGRCVCKPGVLGHKCDGCSAGEFLGPYGCSSDPINLGKSCDDIVCFFGAQCEEAGARTGCTCNFECNMTKASPQEVCGSDGFTYESECLVRLQACRGQKSIWVIGNGPCQELDSSGYSEQNDMGPQHHHSGRQSLILNSKAKSGMNGK